MARFGIREAQSSPSSSVKHGRGKAQPDLGRLPQTIASSSVNRGKAMGSKKKEIASIRKTQLYTCIVHQVPSRFSRHNTNPSRSSYPSADPQYHVHKLPYHQSVHHLKNFGSSANHSFLAGRRISPSISHQIFGRYRLSFSPSSYQGG